MKKKSFYEHIEDLRKVIIKSIFLVFIFSILAYIFKKNILEIITHPLNQELVFLSPTEPIIILIRLSIFIGFLTSFPFLLMFLWNFISEIFSKKKQKIILKYLFASIFLFYGAIVFCYYLVLPIAINFLINFGNLSLAPTLTITNYLSFTIFLLLSFGFLFQFPLVLLALIKLNLVSTTTLKSQRAYVLSVIFITSALISPPDLFSLFLLALPLILLFEITLIIARIKIV